MLAHFWDPHAGGFFFTSDDHEALIVRSKPAFDGSIPSGNSVAARDSAAPLSLHRARPTISTRRDDCCGCSRHRCASSRSASPTCSARSTSTRESRARSSSSPRRATRRRATLLRRIRSRYLPNRTLTVVDPARRRLAAATARRQGPGRRQADGLRLSQHDVLGAGDDLGGDRAFAALRGHALLSAFR